MQSASPSCVFMPHELEVAPTRLNGLSGSALKDADVARQRASSSSYFLGTAEFKTSNKLGAWPVLPKGRFTLRHHIVGSAMGQRDKALRILSILMTTAAAHQGILRARSPTGSRDEKKKTASSPGNPFSLTIHGPCIPHIP